LGTLVPAIDPGECLLLEIRQKEREKRVSTGDDFSLRNGERGIDPPRGKHAIGVVMLVAGQAELLQFVRAGHAAG
jgi:hypothetical protein